MTIHNFPTSQRPAPETGGPTGGNDGGTMPPMDRLGEVERKVDRLEINMQHVTQQLGEIKAEIKSGMSNAKWQLLAAVVAIALAVYGTSYSIQQMTVSTFQAASQQAPLQPAPPTIIYVQPGLATSSPPPAAAASR